MDIELILLIAVLAVGSWILILLLGSNPGRIRKDIRTAGSQLRDGIRTVGGMVREEGRQIRQDSDRSLRENRSEMTQALTGINGMMTQTMEAISAHQQHELRELTDQISRLEQQLGEDLHYFEERFSRNVRSFNEMQSEKFGELIADQRIAAGEREQQFEELKLRIDARLESMQKDNQAKLEQMRETVDEKLQETVRQRFGESFQLISDRLEQVHKGLGEMQSLAAGVGDLQRVLTNVKTRGTLGEIQLGTLLEQMLAPEQFVRNAHPDPHSREVVEFAVRLPGTGDSPVLLPVDSKFPLEAYERLQAGADAGVDTKQMSALRRAFEASVRKNARDIRQKYIRPPMTTDFALMFVPTEGLYAEILRSPGLFDSLQREERVTVVGPANLSAFLSSLQMGFRTLAIEKRSSEVWQLLGAVKSDFARFGDVLEKTRAQLERTMQTIDDAGRRTRAIERRLRDVEDLPGASDGPQQAGADGRGRTSEGGRE